jgi:hypothetical protein
VPESAAFYHATLRLGEQWNAVANSRAWAKLKEMPLVKMAQGMYALQKLSSDSVPAKIDAALNEPETRKLIDLGIEMISQEMFLYGGSSFIDLLELMQELGGSTRFGPALAKLTEEGKGQDPNKLRVQAAIASLAENPARIKVPEIVLGFKIKNVKLAQEQLDRLHNLVAQALDEQPQIKVRWQKATVAGNQCLTLTLEGKMLPWDEVPLDKMKEMEAEKGDIDKIVARLKELKLVLALGLRGDFLLASIGPSTEVLARLGQGKPLSSRPELAPLAKFAGKRLTHVSYDSKALNAGLGTSKKDIDSLREMIEGLLPALDVPKEMQEELRKDAAALAADLKPHVPDPGATMSVGFLTAEGSESYSFDWGEHPEVDGSKPLGLLEHVGGNPILALVDRSKVSVEDYNLVSKWVATAYRYVEKYAIPKMKEDERAKFQKFMTDAIPLAKRLDNANRTMLLPALADGQTGLVIDAKLTSKQFVKTLPATQKPLPMIEPALIFGVSDAALVRKAFAEYRAIADGLLAAVRKIEGNPVPPDLKIPDAQVSEVPGGSVYSYPLRAAWGVDPKVAPNGGLSEHVGVLSVSRPQTERLLKAAPPTVGGRSVPKDRELAGLSMFDFAGLIDALTPWVDMGFDQVLEQKALSGLPIDLEAVRDQAHTVLDVLKCFRNCTTETYLEGKVLVKHTRTEVRDLK